MIPCWRCVGKPCEATEICRDLQRSAESICSQMEALSEVCGTTSLWAPPPCIVVGPSASDGEEWSYNIQKAAVNPNVQNNESCLWFLYYILDTFVSPVPVLVLLSLFHLARQVISIQPTCRWATRCRVLEGLHRRTFAKAENPLSAGKCLCKQAQLQYNKTSMTQRSSRGARPEWLLDESRHFSFVSMFLFIYLFWSLPAD